MKKLKKILALMCAMVMMLSMSTVAFATESAGDSDVTGKASITVKGLAKSDKVTVSIYKIATASNAGEWTIEGWAKNYVTAPTGGATEYTFDWAGMQTAAASVDATATKDIYGKSEVTFEGLDGAAYLVLAKGGKTTYSVMGAKTYTYTDGRYTLTSAIVNAKTSDVPTTKTSDDHFVYAGETVTFTITTVLPAAKTLNDQNQEVNNEFKVYEQPENLTGLTLKSVKIDDVDQTGIEMTDTTADTIMGMTGAYTIDLTSLLADNEGKTVVLTLTGVVEGDAGYTNAAWNNKTETDTEGKPVINPGTPENPEEEVKGYTADITITKYDEQGAEGGNTLTGAKFSLSKTEGGEALKFTQKTDDNGNAIAGQYIYDKNGAVTEVAVDENGAVKLTGLDEGTYYITETEAPEGYSLLNGTADKVTIEVTDTTVNKNISATSNVADTKLASLPFTGGMGTTLFTVFGVIIMAAAAGLFFANKKKSAK